MKTTKPMPLTVAEIQAIVSLADAGVKSAGIRAFATVDSAALSSALAKLQQMADAAEKP